MIPAPDRIEKLLAQTNVTGIDFIYVYPDQVTLEVYFILDPSTLSNPLQNATGPVRIYSTSGVVPDIPVISSQVVAKSGTINVLRVKTAYPGNFALYNLIIIDNRIDPYYNDVPFSFKANCPSDLDCKPLPPDCPPDEPVDFQIDYSARDFWSFRRALLEFASVRYPSWPDRLAADAGVMLAEIFSAVGDEMAYYQDRVGREAYLESASQRRSIRRHARLVDYTVHDGLGSSAWMDITVKAGMSGNIPAGTNVWSSGQNNTRTDFEIGHGLSEMLQGKNYAVDALRNQYSAYRWDESQTCLPALSTEMYISGAHAADLVFDDFPVNQPKGKWVLLETTPDNPAQQIRRQMVRLLTIRNETDPVLGVPITHLIWEISQATEYEMDMTCLYVRGNMIPATAGKTNGQFMLVGADLTDFTAHEQTGLNNLSTLEGYALIRSVERTGDNGSIAYLNSMLASEDLPLVWLGNDPVSALPEIHLQQLGFSDPNWVNQIEPWNWQRTLVGVDSAKSEDRSYTLDDGIWRRVVGYRLATEEFIHNDYASGSGVTIRFGDGEFGLIPAVKSVFRALYRVGGGVTSNIAAEAIHHFDTTNVLLSFIDTLTNPIPAINGVDPQTPDEVRQSAPEAFRTITYRAVRPEDYAEAAERLPWVQKAGAQFRWTGSWLTVFVTSDPHNSVMMTDVWRSDLENQLNRFRQAGREAFTMDPLYADIDLEIEVCARPDVFPGELKERIMEALFGKSGFHPETGYFSPDHFTFGDPLIRSTLEAIIQEVTGVKAVENIIYRRRGWFDWKPFDDYFYDPGKNSIIRVENDLLHPERGILKLYIHGAA